MSKNMVFVFLSSVYLIQSYYLKFHPFSCKWHNFILRWARRLVHSCLAIVNSVTRNMGVQLSLLYVDLLALDICLSVKAEPSLISLMNLHTAFHSGYTNLHSHQQCVGFLLPTHHILTSICFSWWLPILLGWDGISV
jgi:hypothetical protein